MSGPFRHINHAPIEPSERNLAFDSEGRKRTRGSLLVFVWYLGSKVIAILGSHLFRVRCAASSLRNERARKSPQNSPAWGRRGGGEKGKRKRGERIRNSALAFSCAAGASQRNNHCSKRISLGSTLTPRPLKASGQLLTGRIHCALLWDRKHTHRCFQMSTSSVFSAHSDLVPLCRVILASAAVQPSAPSHR